MENSLILIPILLPLLAGGLLRVIPFKSRFHSHIFTAVVVFLNSAVIAALLACGVRGRIDLLQITPEAAIALRIDGLSTVFAGLIAGLWPLALLYAFEYMRCEGREKAFFIYYTMSYGVAAGVAFSANLVTMYLFYEVLTLITLPLIMHDMDVKAIDAGRKYLMYSVFGAAFAFMAIMVLLHIAGTTDFVYGGVLTGVDVTGKEMLIQVAYLTAFLGFGVKAAVWPFCGWLPTAGVAPTPVTALLHAVAVVKAGIFAVMRVTYYSFGTDLLRGTWVQNTVMCLASFTLVYGLCRAVKEQHLKRRLAYSTVSNLSYILVGVTLMTPDGLGAGLTHMIFHGVMKSVLFFAAGAVIAHAHREYIWQMKGIGRSMPLVFTCFIVGSIALVGVPGLCGFLSKYELAHAAVESGQGTAVLGVAALILSAGMTAVYLFTVVVTVFTPVEEERMKEPVADAGLLMKIPMVILCVMMLLFGLFSGPLIRYFMAVGAGRF